MSLITNNDSTLKTEKSKHSKLLKLPAGADTAAFPDRHRFSATVYQGPLHRSALSKLTKVNEMSPTTREKMRE
ncbi:unnamed protein product [Fusarium graminearum]|uniref:Chromosome 1, complete genome n=1 Tax=Gibberella zeae (strain ATCC MYA-4620 / CBS 123657 / FGSC 9075 / NRRL 31084 / PH-1) TaxID=229533 RepID=A0A098D2R0_GIBZE|nr:unnamed protein product [Fusarium graminearum]CZS75483.1 unnamed protein product [Fusarium graminearum]